MSDDNITKLPVKFRTPPDESRTLFAPWEVGKPKPCYHSAFVVDQEKSEVECAKCGEKLNPMWVLSYLATQDRNMVDNYRHAHEAMNLLEQRRRAKCEHCGRMTRLRGL